MSTPNDTQTPRAGEGLLDRILTGGAPPTEGAGERILAAAIQQVEDFGVRRFTIDDVARRVGISRVTIYRHFPKKNRLVEAVMLHELHKFLRQIESVIEPCETLEERLVEGFVFALTFLREHRLLNRLLRTEPELLLPMFTLRAAPILTAAREFIAGFARREAQRGALAIPDEEIAGLSELLARAIISFLLTPDSVLGLQTPAQTRNFAERYLAPILHSLEAAPRRSAA
jgi:AcrR family transcriptional regulator